MTHKFKNEIIDWLNGGEYEWKFDDRDICIWSEVRRVSDFDVAAQVRKVDEYKHLREALARGETLQVLDSEETKWIDIDWEPNFTQPANEYRIKPKTKKMVQWLVKNDLGQFIETSVFYEVGEIPTYYFKPIKPLPHTEIEIEE